jgi:CheY-like chemotaxis protein
MEHDRSNILVVDDDPAILEYAGEALEECGYAVLTALSAATALVMLRNSERIDLLFTDLVMPGSDGIEPKGYRPHRLAGAVAAALAG